MAVTSLIKPIPNDRGIFYSMQSAINDIALTFNHDNKKFRFSKYVLLNIPTMGAPEDLDEDNKMQFPAVGEVLISGIHSSDYNLNMAESFQNYCLNFEALLLSQPNYDHNQYKTIAERVFWKWLKETGAIRWRAANTVNEWNNVATSDARYVEADDDNSEYDRVVRFVGDIDAVNSVRSTNSYSEIYIYLPTNMGSTPTVLFDSYADVNYDEDMRVLNYPDDPLDVEYLAGRHYDDTHPFGLRLNAFFDLDDGTVDQEMADLSDPTPTYAPGYWHSDDTNNAYYTDPVFDMAKDYRIKKTLGTSTIEYIRSSLDGVMIDFDISNYKLTTLYDGVNSFTQFNQIAHNQNRNFEFNAILVYYDLYETTTSGGEENTVTNLYGILFLDQVENMGVGADFAIPTMKKYKPDDLNKTNGNSFAYKINIKFDSSIDNVAVERSINDYATFSLDLYMDALSSMSQLLTSYNESLFFMTNLSRDLDELKGQMLNDANMIELRSRLTTIENSLIQNDTLWQDANGVMGLIRDLYSKYDEILRGEATVDVSYNLDPLTIANLIPKNQKYTIGTTYEGNILDNLDLPLLKYTNYFRHNHTSTIELDSEIEITIDDAEQPWARGQVFRLVFEKEFIPGVHSVKIYTDANGVFNGTAYGKLIYVLNNTDFEESNDRPIFDIMCVAPETMDFVVDKIR